MKSEEPLGCRGLLNIFPVSAQACSMEDFQSIASYIPELESTQGFTLSCSDFQEAEAHSHPNCLPVFPEASPFPH